MKKTILITFLFLLSMVGASFAESAGTSEQGKRITGIVIDARGMGLETVMSPTIYDKNGQIVNSIIPDDLGWISKNGTVDYYDSIKEVLDGKSRVGENYILIKAIEVRDFKANPVISIDDAKKLKSLPEFNYILKKSNIIFIK
ncbi:hypothetical protein [Pelosinus baikalensis]|uniref:Uncharacterized protein n=1 Tax=Pelosinus baikalensis TaxID=2892015 RepID=A0ABS8HPJ7_9FIRM|nr:hypothetical protein [Pelosinus baikalensis]MCC5464561.1 hypothetical protein [Pelosinus baikalensis]